MLVQKNRYSQLSSVRYNMHAVSAIEEARNKESVQFSVVLALGDNDHEYDVTLPIPYYEKIAKRACTEKEFVEKAFRFLLEHESPDMILSSFEIPLIQSYFPNFEKEIMSY